VQPLVLADQQQLIDESERLLASAQPGTPAILSWSQASREGLVLGFSQKPGILNQEELARRPIPIYHRRAGGTAVLVGSHLLGLDVVLPQDHPLILPDLVESYRWLGETWVAALHALGVDARVVPPDEAHEQRAFLKEPATQAREEVLRRACYGSLSPYEVVVGRDVQRKVVGLDMIRRRNGTLLQAGVLLSWNPDRLAELLGHTPVEQNILRDGLRERAVGLDALAGRDVPPEEVIQAFESTFKNALRKRRS
jgi:lipoate-protein ligase A